MAYHRRPGSSASSNYDFPEDKALDELIQDMPDEVIMSSPSPHKTRSFGRGYPLKSNISSASSTSSGSSSGSGTVKGDSSGRLRYPVPEAPSASFQFAVPQTPSKLKGKGKETYRDAQASPSTPLRSQASYVPTTPKTPATPSANAILSSAVYTQIRDAFENNVTLASPTPKGGGQPNPKYAGDTDSDEEKEVESIVISRPLFKPNPLTPSNSMSSVSTEDSFWSSRSKSSSMSSIWEKPDTDIPSPAPSPSKRRKLEKIDTKLQTRRKESRSPTKAQRSIVDEEQDFFAGPSTSAPSPAPSYKLGNPFSRRDLRPQKEANGSPYYTADTSDKCYIPSRLKPPADIPDAVKDFCIETDALEANIIAHDAETQVMMDKYKIAWGVQYELTRGVTHRRWTWEDVRTKLHQLTGTNAEAAHRVPGVMDGSKAPPNGSTSNNPLWRELDREEDAILENLSRGLGLMGPWKGQDDWYGGKIQQIARLIDGNPYKIILERLESKRSYRFARFYGSRRILQLKIPDALVNDEKSSPKLKAFLEKKFVLCGRVFVPYHIKDGKLYLVEIADDKFRKPHEWCGDQHLLSFGDFCNWHNPIALNFEQPLAKLIARNALGFSNSVPVLEFKAHNIMYLGDIYSESYTSGKAEAKDLMTDGAGFINKTALALICQNMGYNSLPAAVQGRIAGSKGLFIMHPFDSNPEPRIWIRDSQHKIHLPQPLRERSHRILDLLCVSMPSSSVSLSQQSIQNLAYNQVPAELLISLLKEGMASTFTPLLEWKRPNAMFCLADAINKIGRVHALRLQRLISSQSRAYGLTRGEWRRESVELETEEEVVDKVDNDVSSITGRIEESGMPLSMYEFALELIEAGFNPADNAMLREKISYIIKQTIDTAVEKCKIPLPYSASGFIIPDPLGVLNEGEIYYHSSQTLKDPATSLLLSPILTGNILARVGRYPLRLPSDMQKVKAVDVYALHEYTDVIVASTKGSHSLASMLAGGDHDGDEPFLIWHPEVVERFQSNSTEVTPPPSNLNDYFEREIQTVTDFCESTKALRPRYFAQQGFMAALLLGLTDYKVGLYSNFHENAIEKHGYSHKESIRMAYMFNTLLDASKTGHKLKNEVFFKDRARFGSAPDEEKISGNSILSRIRQAAEQTRKEINEHLSALKAASSGDDKDLKKPYDAFMKVAEYALDNGNFRGFYDQIEVIKHQVKAAHELFLQSCASNSTGASFATPSKKKKPKQSKKSDEYKIAAARTFNTEIPGLPLVTDAKKLMASYAYHLSPSFAFTVAFNQLCAIKADSLPGGAVSTCRSFNDVKTISSSAIRALTKSSDDDTY